MPHDEPQNNDDPWNDFARELGADVPEDNSSEETDSEAPGAPDDTPADADEVK